MLKESNVNMVLTVSLVNLKFPTVKPSLFFCIRLHHKKQSGGAGQYGRVIGEMNPIESENKFETQIIGVRSLKILVCL